MKKGILLAVTLVWMSAVGNAGADQAVKKSAHLTRSQFQEQVKARHNQKLKHKVEISGTAQRGAPQVSPFVAKR